MGFVAVRWDPKQEDVFFLTQAASLSALHYYIQCAVHRPFLSDSRRGSPLSFPSIIICTNGARASIQVLEVLYKRTGSPSFRNTVIKEWPGRSALLHMLMSRWLGGPVRVRDHFVDEHAGAQARGSNDQHRKGPGLGGKSGRDVPLVAI